MRGADSTLTPGENDMAARRWFPMWAVLLTGMLLPSPLEAADRSGDHSREPQASSKPLDTGIGVARHQHDSEELAEATAEFERIPLWFGSSPRDVGLRAQIVARMCRVARFHVSTLYQVVHGATEKAKQRRDGVSLLRTVNVLILTRCMFKVPPGKHNPSVAGELLWPLSAGSDGQLLLTGSWTDGGGVSEDGGEKDFIYAQKRYGLRAKPGVVEAPR